MSFLISSTYFKNSIWIIKSLKVEEVEIFDSLYQRQPKAYKFLCLFL